MMKTRFGAFLLALTLLFSLCTSAVFAAGEEDTTYGLYDATGKITVYTTKEGVNTGKDYDLWFYTKEPVSVVDAAVRKFSGTELKAEVGDIFLDTSKSYTVTIRDGADFVDNGPIYFVTTFDANGGAWSDGDTTKTVRTDGSTAVNAPDTNPANGSKTFNGWFDAATGGEKVTTFEAGKTYYAQYSDGGSTPAGPSGGGSSGGGGGGSAATVTKTPTSNGSYTLSNSNAKAGDTVTITPKPNAGYEVDAVTVTDKNGNAIATTKNADGTYSFTMPASDLQPVKTAVTFKKSGEAPSGRRFVDVPDGEYYTNAVDWAVEKGITNGTDDTHFSPDVSCTRAQMVTFLWRAAGSPEPANSAAFSDVQSGSYYEKAVAWAVENGITNGTGDNLFSPDATVTRAQVVTFLYRYEKASAGTNNPFTDVADDAYYAAAVSWAVENGITNGTSATTFSPDDDCTRGQIVTFLYRDMAE